jgi:hypothetical protein
MQDAVEFLMLADQQEAAFQTARLHDAMHIFTQCLPKHGAAMQEGYTMAVGYYEERAMWEQAADLHAHLANLETAVTFYMQVWNPEI